MRIWLRSHSQCVMSSITKPGWRGNGASGLGFANREFVHAMSFSNMLAQLSPAPSRSVASLTA